MIRHIKVLFFTMYTFCVCFRTFSETQCSAISTAQHTVYILVTQKIHETNVYSKSLLDQMNNECSPTPSQNSPVSLPLLGMKEAGQPSDYVSPGNESIVVPDSSKIKGCEMSLRQ